MQRSIVGGARASASAGAGSRIHKKRPVEVAEKGSAARRGRRSVARIAAKRLGVDRKVAGGVVEVVEVTSRKGREAHPQGGRGR